MPNKSSFRFWRLALKGAKSHWLVRLVTWLLFTFYAGYAFVRDYWLPSEYRNAYLGHYVPSMRSYWYVYVIAFLFLALVTVIVAVPAAVRAREADLQAENAKALARKGEVLQRYRDRMRRNVQPVAPPAGVLAEPHILQRPIERIWVKQDDEGYFIECPESESEKEAFVVPYRNERMRGLRVRRVGDAEHVVGQVSWRSHDGTLFSIPSHPIVWLSEKAERVNFRRDGEPHTAVLVTLGDGQYFAVHRQTGTLGKAVRELPLIGTIWRGQVELFAENEPIPVCKSDLVFEVNPSDESERLTLMVSWRQLRLHRASISGYEALLRHHEKQQIETDAFNYSAWEKETADFIGRNYTGKERAKFLFEQSHRFSSPAPVEVSDRLARQLQVLKGLENQAGT